MSDLVDKAIGEITILFEDDNEVVDETPDNTEETVEEEATDIEVDETDDIEDSEPVDDDVNPEKGTRAQERIRKLVAEKKALEEQIGSNTATEVQQLRQMVNDLLTNKPKDSVQPTEAPEFDNQQEFAEYIKTQTLSEVSKLLQEQLQPVQQQTANQQYVSQIDGWIKANPEAAQIRDAMDTYSDSFSPAEKQFYQKQIIGGNTSILDMIYTQVASKNQGLVKSARGGDKSKAIMPKGKVSTSSVGKSELSDSDLIKKAYKDKDFTAVAEAVLGDYFK